MGELGASRRASACAAVRGWKRSLAEGMGGGGGAAEAGEEKAMVRVGAKSQV